MSDTVLADDMLHDSRTSAAPTPAYLVLDEAPATGSAQMTGQNIQGDAHIVQPSMAFRMEVQKV